MDGSLHDRDFVTRTQDQAAARPNLVEGLALPNLAAAETPDPPSIIENSWTRR